MLLRPRCMWTTALLAASLLGSLDARSQPATDLDAFMDHVLARRDENWRKLQQYVLDEREIAELQGPGGARLYGMDREFTWYIRDGVFVRSPIRFDGVTLGEDTRRRYEQDWLERERRRSRDEGVGAADTSRRDQPAVERGPASIAGGGEALLQQLREPRFVSAAYFLKFRFERGRYGLVGPELYEGRRVLRIEYYPTRLFSANDDPGDDPSSAETTDGRLEQRLEHQMNKVALITLWIEPEAHQIVKYTFENLDLDFLPGRWLARAEDLRATMRMQQPFPDVWLPGGIEARGALTLASGTYEVKYQVTYDNYREAEVKARVR